jgi:hypothetical protein
MASLTYNNGSFRLQDRGSGTVDFLSDVIEFVLLKTTATYTPNKDDTAGTMAAGEISGVSGYTAGYGGAGRKVLGSKTITNDTTNDRTVYDCADPTAWTLGTGDTVAAVGVQKKGSANDTTAVPLWYLDITDFPTNGSTFTLTIHADGLGYTQQ